MQFYVRKRKTPFLLVVPLIDILAILLIFFIVTTKFRDSLPQLQINLPDSKTAQPAPAKEREPIVLRVKSETEITLGNEPVALDVLVEKLRQTTAAHPERAIAMQADREAPFGLIVQILDILKESGLKNIPTFTQPQAASD